MTFGERELAQIGRYVKAELPTWLDELGPWRVGGPLYERAVRVEEELRAQRELMLATFEGTKARFDDVNRRFDDVNRRFEDVNQRFEASDRRHTATQWMIGIGFTAVTTLMTLYRFLA